ncbi:hypothetical protein BCR33DRAFT_582228 [Rhizoclosmatium globosum]|uniref:XPG N-terminal domain-containing protein n=1 Tax=Rhizoclosmatium globosum TaxID=329046 RepID=A0A1Y2CSQ9_9FUNG|nr:hypothetical protein BCR33DRAFT_582228 [Rhizoclosmatium globosum]|eukprot:ORY49415.1 hypothetical protein BCR33DRAFT_582228 [Rhizoclosmatium globosum]
MGVKGLWQLLESSSETVPLETLCGKVVAVDASIWLFQFVKALRDADGNAVRGGHVKGFFSRICKLLFVGVKPVFVFDGATPMLKRATVRKRRERKSDASSSVERTAEKLLQQQLRLRALTAASKPSKNDDKSMSVTDGANYLDWMRPWMLRDRQLRSNGLLLHQALSCNNPTTQQPPAKKHKLDPSMLTFSLPNCIPSKLLLQQTLVFWIQQISAISCTLTFLLFSLMSNQRNWLV